MTLVKIEEEKNKYQECGSAPGCFGLAEFWLRAPIVPSALAAAIFVDF